MYDSSVQLLQFTELSFIIIINVGHDFISLLPHLSHISVSVSNADVPQTNKRMNRNVVIPAIDSIDVPDSQNGSFEACSHCSSTYLRGVKQAVTR